MDEFPYFCVVPRWVRVCASLTLPLSHSPTLSLSHSLTLSLSHSLTLSLSLFCLITLSLSISHSLAFALSHSLAFALSLPPRIFPEQVCRRREESFFAKLVADVDMLSFTNSATLAEILDKFVGEAERRVRSTPNPTP